MVVSNKNLIFVENLTIMAKHELTEKQIAALQKLGVMPSRFYKTHIPINNNNVFFNGRTNWKKLGIAIAVDVYTSVEGIKRKRYCFDCVRNNLSDNYTESNIRQLDKFVTHYLNILLNPCPSATILSKMMTTNMN
nr:MAG TPA: hypothetical protein [Bacteriophage sp.]